MKLYLGIGSEEVSVGRGLFAERVAKIFAV